MRGTGGARLWTYEGTYRRPRVRAGSKGSSAVANRESCFILWEETVDQGESRATTAKEREGISTELEQFVRTRYVFACIANVNRSSTAGASAASADHACSEGFIISTT